MKYCTELKEDQSIADKTTDKSNYGTVSTFSNFMSHTKDVISHDYSSVLDEKIHVPESENYDFSWKKLWAFSGPGFLMSIAYLDPGNIEADLKAGTEAKYALLWILMWATILGLFIQRLAARLGAVTGEDLAETCRRRFTPLPRYTLWIMLEITIIAADMQEVIGTAIALYLLSSKKIPIWGGVLLTIFDTFTFLFLDKYGLRKLEAFFAFLIAVMAVTFGYEYIMVQPDQVEVVKGLFIPGCASCSSRVLLQAVGIVGALITPHNLYLHSSLVKSRQINRKNKAEVSDANRYYFIESAIALFVSLVINIFVIGVFAAGMNDVTNSHVSNLCHERGINASDVFDEGESIISGDIYRGGIFLGCEFGTAYLYIWAVGLLAAGQSSTMTGTYTGQFVMEGFLHMKWKRWKRVLLTRTIAILPTVSVAVMQDVNHVSGMNDFLNALMSMQLPFALLTTYLFTASKTLMGDFVNDRKNNIFMGVVTTFLISLNLYFVTNFVMETLPMTWIVFICFGIFLVFYTVVLGFLTLCLLVVLGCNRLTKLPVVGVYLEERYEFTDFTKLVESTETLNEVKMVPQ
ncbi:natural resistance-associated macrophage protein 2-like isoform X2 [Argiope bruennichi]|nr:natural resistance-associated macrophage protein 2-like isoform X2 [Argiope bruennichi]